MIIIILKRLVAIVSFCVLLSEVVDSASAAIIPNAYLWGTGGAFLAPRAGANTVNGGGNNGTTNDVDPNQMWLTQNANRTIEWALPRNFDLSDIHVWNYNESVINSGHGLRNVDIAVASSLAGSYTSLGTFTFPQASGVAGYTGFDVSSLAGWAAQSNVAKVRFTPAASNGSWNNIAWGLSEVRFVTPNTLSTAPTPVSTPITTVTVQAVSTQLAGRTGLDTIDGSGLVSPSFTLHDSNADNMWETSTASGTHFITYDLSGASSGAQSLGRVQIWNFAGANGTLEAAHIRLLVSPDNNIANLVTVGEFQARGRNASQVSASGANIPSYDLDFSSLTSAQLALLDNVELVRLQIMSNVGSITDTLNGGNVVSLTGFSEVRFFNEAPPAMIGLSAPVSSTIITGGTGATGATITNTAGSGANSLNYTLTSADMTDGATFGAFSPGNTGSLGSLANQAFTRAVSSTNVGSNTIRFTATDAAAGNSPQTIDTTLTVLNHADAEFVGGSLDTLTLNFGLLSANTGAYNLPYQIQNLLASFRAGLELDSFSELGDDGNPLAGDFTTNATLFPNLASGSASSFFDVFFDTTGLAGGLYSATYVFDMSDQNLPGAINRPQLTLVVNAEIQDVPEPSTYALGLIGLVGLGLVAWRRRK